MSSMQKKDDAAALKLARELNMPYEEVHLRRELALLGLLEPMLHKLIARNIRCRGRPICVNERGLDGTRHVGQRG